MDLKSMNIDKCPFCGSRNIGEGYQDGYATVRVKNKIFRSSQINYIICADCGSVLRSYVKEPEKFLPPDK